MCQLTKSEKLMLQTLLIRNGDRLHREKSEPPIKGNKSLVMMYDKEISMNEKMYAKLN